MRKTECTSLNFFTGGLLDPLWKLFLPPNQGRLRIVLAGLLMVLSAGWATDVQAQCTLVCNDNAQVSLPGLADNCEALIGHPMVLTSPLAVCPGPKTLTVYDLNGNPLPSATFGVHTGSLVDEKYVGQTLTVKVRDNTTGNHCWGAIHVEDKLGPDIVGCRDTMLFCLRNPKPVSRGGHVPDPTFFDCYGSASLSIAYIDSVFNGTCTDDFSQRIRRTWIATDPAGNTSTCTQTIIMKKVSLRDYMPVCPPNVDLECNNLTAPNTLPDSTGFPTITINGTIFNIKPGGGSVCEIAASYKDETFDLCGGGYKILRTWTIYDWCLPTRPGLNPFTCIQVIKVEDKKPPIIRCPAPLTVNTNSASCAANVTLLPAVVSDSCSGFGITIVTPVGYLYTNGGLIRNVPVGVHTITYIATDDCGNVAQCTTTLTVKDEVPPVAVCDEFTVVSLTSDGTAMVYAETFDDGSRDNCAIDSFQVRRMPNDCEDPTYFRSYANFSCCDIGDTVQVIFRVFDKSRNYNDCMVEVWVQDKLPPVIDCPPNKTVDCSEHLVDLSRFGYPTATDNCDSVRISERVVRDLDQCGTGYIERIFTATDMGGRTASCTQRIDVVNMDVFTRDDIDFPKDWTTNICGVSTDPDDIPCDSINYCRPILNSNACGLIAVTKEDQLLPIAFPACYKILRKWIVIDWCQYNPNATSPVGYWSWTQVIKVLDDEAPVLDCPVDTVRVDNFSAHCDSAFVNIPAVTATDCSPDLDFTVKIDYNRNGIFETTFRGNNASGYYPEGTHLVHIKVEDNCGNFSTCDIIVIVRDKKKPTPICLNGVSVTLMPNGAGGGMVVLTPMMFNNKSFDNCTPENLLKYKLTPNTFTCDEIGLNLVRLSVTDLAGNTDFCETFVDIQDNMNVCDTSGTGTRTFNIAGSVKDPLGNGISNVRMDLSGGGNFLNSFTTNADGSYSFTGLVQGYDYSVAPNLNAGLTNGVSTFDLVLISKHVLNVKYLDSPYKIIAADANKSGNVSTLDIVSIRKAILRVSTEFPNNTAWRFVDKNFVFPNPMNPFATPIPQAISFNNLSASHLAANFVAIKVGDVNGDALPNNTLGVDNRTYPGTLQLHTAERQFKAGEMIEVPVVAEDFSGIVGYQFTIEFNPNVMELSDVQADQLENLTKSNFGFTMVDDGIITTSWDNSKTTLSSKTGLFTLQFRAKTSGSLSDVLKISSQYTKAEAYASVDNNFEPRNVTLEFDNGKEGVAGFELYQNKPNPFNQFTVIGFNLPHADEATLTIYDLSGKVVKVYRGLYDQGYQEIRVKNDDLRANGVFYYRLETTDNTATRKMILVN